jgi:tetratricopeptide (TPR) repeat protein
MRFLYKTTIIVFFFIIPSISWSRETVSHQEADRLEAQAVDLIDNNRMEEGMVLMKQAMQIDPTPMRHMNYGSILFGNGAAEFESGNKAKAQETLYEAQDQLAQAIAGFNPKKEAVFIAQAYFLLGEMYLNAFSNEAKARMFYYKALSYYDNPGARAAVEKLQ